MKGSEVLQRDHDRPEHWAITNHMKFTYQILDFAPENVILNERIDWGTRAWSADLQKGIWRVRLTTSSI